MDKPINQATENAGFAPRCLSLDLEVGKTDSRIHQFAGVRGDTQEAYVYSKGPLGKALEQLDAFASGVAFLLGHNLIAFDAPHLEAAKPDLRLLKLPRVDINGKVRYIVRLQA